MRYLIVKPVPEYLLGAGCLYLKLPNLYTHSVRLYTHRFWLNLSVYNLTLCVYKFSNFRYKHPAPKRYSATGLTMRYLIQKDPVVNFCK